MSRVPFVFSLILAVSAYVLSEQDDGYVINEEDGHAYRLVYLAQTWPVARDKCVEESAKLAVPKSEQEFAFIQKIVRGMHYPSVVGSDYRLLAWVGINNIDNYTVWRNVDGENINDTGFHKWSGENGKTFSADPREPHCAGIDATNPGLRDWWCHKQQPYLCEKINIDANRV